MNIVIIYSIAILLAFNAAAETKPLFYGLGHVPDYKERHWTDRLARWTKDNNISGFYRIHAYDGNFSSSSSSVLINTVWSNVVRPLTIREALNLDRFKQLEKNLVSTSRYVGVTVGNDTFTLIDPSNPAYEMIKYILKDRPHQAEYKLWTEDGVNHYEYTTTPETKNSRIDYSFGFTKKWHYTH